MILKRIELIGFKSFADKTVIELSNGISALLGPNGCGKSNVLDAVKWVLGEQSTRSLRADKMSDIIFNGSDKRKSLSMAEVQLIFENTQDSEGRSEIAVKRRIYRDGEGEYFVNNTPVLLRELRSELNNNQIGRSDQYIIEQGKIDRILSSKPEDRRYIFEDAANIGNHRAQWIEADHKLRRTEENVKKIESILLEVQRSYNSLKTQSAKAMEHRKLKEELFTIDRELFLLRLHKLESKKNSTESVLKNSNSQSEKIKIEIREINSEIEQNRKKVSTLSQGLNEANTKLYGIKIELKNIVQQNRSLNERIEEIQLRINQEKTKKEELQKKILGVKEQENSLDHQYSEFNTLLESERKYMKELEVHIQKLHDHINKNKKEIKNLEEENKHIDSKTIIIQTELQKLTDRIVQQLDEKLQSSKSGERKQIEHEIYNSLSKFSTFITGLDQKLQALSLSTVKIEIVFDLLNHALGQSSQFRDRFETLFIDYKEVIPSFIDEFLAPEGIITQKRDIDHQLKTLRASLANNRSHIIDRGNENSDFQKSIKDFQDRHQEAMVNIERNTTELKGITREKQSLHNQINELNNRIHESAHIIGEEEARLHGVDKKTEDLSEEERTLKETEAQYQNEINTIQSELKKYNSMLSENLSKLKSHQDLLSQADSKKQNFTIELTEVQSAIAHVYSTFREKYSKNLNDFEGQSPGASLPELRKQQQNIQGQIQAIGSVNYMAVEDFEEVQERYNFLNTQLNDLKNARKDIAKVTEHIREESTRLFLEAFKQISENFRTLFRALFNGGRAVIKLIDRDNILESGIEILVQPPGKKLESIDLLSGGERSLTAISLIFAAYMLKPAPFCFLDEVDAALDEANIIRFTSILSKFSHNNRIVIITHNKKTVTVAQNLLGITMEEAGISKLVTLRIHSEQNND